ncbi:putative membrane-bound spermidine synthase [Paenibacillus taihuensis]|uniref:Putative membrane-bound spermidine synthase n=1 Tax=Paenibacillus taihuensis TaxID=1156355 RepID=A0A3D9R477_9BACL|nr:fused MFS/spermidine synthase [Paenibacillus taihuensis]REE68122.1 putative membrane-bound spermidine synthase [Paenibacillus taihuensis]
MQFVKFKVSFLYSYVCITGASVMALELAASRFLAPYYGTSMIVWANIIGLILLSLSLGYWIGGRWADRRPDGKLLMLISLAAGVFTSLLPLWGKLIFPLLSNGILDTSLWIILCSFFAILIVFAPPVFLLAMVSPFAIRLVSASEEQIGKTAGNLYAFSTLGSIIGTFGTAFGTIPFLGTRETIFLWSAALIAISSLGLRKSKWKWSALFLLLPVLLYLIPYDTFKQVEGKPVVWSKDTLYQFVRVTQTADGQTSLIYNEGGGVQSMRRPNDALNKNDYYDDYLMLPFLMEKPEQVLVLGSAGGTIPRLLAKYVKPIYPGLHTTGVEIDPEVIKLDSRFFGLQPEDAKLVNQDARVFLDNTEERYDIVIVDCYSQQIYIPFHLSTVEFFQTIENHLNPSGLLALNVNAVSTDSRLLQSMEKTLHQAFPFSYVVRARGDYNYILLGSLTPLKLDKLKAIEADHPLAGIRDEWPKQLTSLTPEQFANGQLLTDNRAPTEMLTDSMIFSAAGAR